MSEIILPRQDTNGEYYISYSQANSFLDAKGFNTGLEGVLEYVKSYFLGERWDDQGWALFGCHTEDYICHAKKSSKEIKKLDKELIESGNPSITEAINSFSDEEKEVLNKIEPLGNFQVEVKYYIFDNVYLLGYIDDATHDLSKIRDYKTASKTSKAKYYKDDYKQLDLYALWVKEKTGKIPEMEVLGIERKGNCFGKVNARDLLSVGEELWLIPRETSEERLDKIKEDLKETVREISDLYKIFKLTNK